jgi:hypothetical protein
MFPALARLIIEASRYSQIWLTSHSAELAELIAAGAPCQRYALENRGGETRIVVKPVIPDGGAESGGALRLCGRQQRFAAA